MTPTVHASSQLNDCIQPRTLASSARNPAETASAFLDRILHVTDDVYREDLIRDAYNRMVVGRSEDRRFWCEVMTALIDGRSEEAKERRHIEFLQRNG